MECNQVLQWERNARDIWKNCNSCLTIFMHSKHKWQKKFRLFLRKEAVLHSWIKIRHRPNCGNEIPEKKDSRRVVLIQDAWRTGVHQLQPCVWSTDSSQTKLWLVKTRHLGSSGDQSPAISLAAPKYRFNFEAGYIGGPTGNIQLMNFVQSSFFSIKKRTRKKETQKDLMSFTESFQLFPLDWFQDMVETTRLLIKLLTLSLNLQRF